VQSAIVMLPHCSSHFNSWYWHEQVLITVTVHLLSCPARSFGPRFAGLRDRRVMRSTRSRNVAPPSGRQDATTVATYAYDARAIANRIPRLDRTREGTIRLRCRSESPNPKPQSVTAVTAAGMQVQHYSARDPGREHRLDILTFLPTPNVSP